MDKEPAGERSETHADRLGFAMMREAWKGTSSTDQTMQAYQLRIWIRQMSQER